MTDLGQHRASTGTHFYQPAEGHRLPHDPFNAIVGPRPIGWISTVDAEGRRNLAPYSFFNAFNYTPPIIGFASNTWKHSVGNIDATRQFGWNLVTAELAAAMNATSATVDAGTDEFALAGLEAVTGPITRAPRVAASPVSFECVLVDIVRLRTKEGDAVDSWLTLGEVVGVHIREDLLEDGVYRTARARPVLRAGGPGDYAQVEEASMFFMPRPA